MYSTDYVNNKFIPLFFFVNSVFLWNCVPFNVLSVVDKALLDVNYVPFCGN